MKMVLKGTLPTAMLLLAMLTPFALLRQVVATRQSTEDEFQALLARYYAAWNTLNPDIAAPLYAKDPELVFYDITPLKYNGWEEYKEGTRKMFSEFMSFEMDMNNSLRAILRLKLTPNNDLKVTRRGTIAWTTETFHLSGQPKTGEVMELDGRHTAIWEERSGKWLIVHEHFSAPLP